MNGVTKASKQRSEGTGRPWTVEQWRQVTFSNENHFCLDENYTSQYAISARRISFRVSMTVKHSLKVTVWGCVSATGVGRIQFVKVTINAAKYIPTLETRILLSEKEMFPERDFVFQDDNAPCYRAKDVQNWFTSRDMSLQSPGKSPDLNQIEYLWHKEGYKM